MRRELCIHIGLLFGCDPMIGAIVNTMVCKPVSKRRSKDLFKINRADVTVEILVLYAFFVPVLSDAVLECWQLVGWRHHFCETPMLGKSLSSIMVTSNWLCCFDKEIDFEINRENEKDWLVE